MVAVNRFKVPTRHQIVDLLMQQADYDNPMLKFTKLLEDIQEKGSEISAESLESIFDRYDAWVDPYDCESHSTEAAYTPHDMMRGTPYDMMRGTPSDTMRGGV